MKSKILRLLEVAGLPLEKHQWNDLILLHNGARIPPLLPIRGNFIWNWGFNLLIIGAEGKPTHFGKCRAATPEVIEATRLRVLLSRDATCGVVPMTWAAEHEGLHIELSRYLPGRMYDAILPGLDERGWRQSMQEIVDATDCVSRRAPTLGMSGPARDAVADFHSESVRSLSRLEAIGFDRADLDLLAELLEAGGSMTRRPQHGDLWARNIVRFDERWWLLDFDIFGQVQVPLFDVCHLVATSTEQRATVKRLPRRSWLARLRDGEPLAKPGLDVIRWLAAREALAPAAFVAAYVHYLVEAATRLYDRGAERVYWEPAMTDLQLAVDCERNGPRLVELLTLRDVDGLPRQDSTGDR